MQENMIKKHTKEIKTTKTKTIKNLIWAQCLAWSLLLSMPLSADEHAVNSITVASKSTVTPLVELYTSEGCSSCPPADDLLSRLGSSAVENFKLVALAFHVDYWNWLGWRDPYSQAKFTKRQRYIAQINRQRSIYTPELVVSGREARGGNKIYALIDEYNRKQAEVAIELSLASDSPTQITADLDIDSKTRARNAEVFLAVFENNIVREIGAGENSGKTLTHNFVVRHWSNPYRLKKGMTQKTVVLPVGEDWNKSNLGVVAVVIDRKNGETLQAVSTEVASLY